MNYQVDNLESNEVHFRQKQTDMVEQPQPQGASPSQEHQLTPLDDERRRYFFGTLALPKNPRYSKRQNDPSKFDIELRSQSLEEYLEGTLFGVLENIATSWWPFTYRKIPGESKEERSKWVDKLRIIIKAHIEALREFEKMRFQLIKELSPEELDSLFPEDGREYKVPSSLDEFLKYEKIIVDQIIQSLPDKEVFSGIIGSRSELQKYFYSSVASLIKIINTIMASINPLFSHIPCVEDIQQTHLGDCFLLSALMALINSPKFGPKFIMNMMIDNGDGTVTVKLFKLTFDKDGNFSSATAVFIKVYKHGFYQGSQSALWVQILEKAYAIIGGNFMDKKAAGDKEYKNRDREIMDLDGGMPSYSFMTLTGQRGIIYSPICDGIFNVRDFFSFISETMVADSFSCTFCDAIKTRLDSGYPVTTAFNNKFKVDDITIEDDVVKKSEPSKQITVFSRHEYTVVDVDTSNMYIIVINPHADAIDKNKKKKRIYIPEEMFENNVLTIDTIVENDGSVNIKK